MWENSGTLPIFSKIVHYDKIKKFNSVNIREGYKPIDIYSPMEVANE
ncbi:MAG: hypothetical protein AABY79_02140 [Nitrospirota bacterium]